MIFPFECKISNVCKILGETRDKKFKKTFIVHIDLSENARPGRFNISWHFNFIFYFKDTHREKAPSNKIPALTKTINIWVVGTSNQLFIRGSYTETKF